MAIDQKILGKPTDETDACNMLRSLSGRTHQVYTGITIKTADKIFTETDVADVTFNEITDEEIQYYIQNYKPFDKAGSYGTGMAGNGQDQKPDR